MWNSAACGPVYRRTARRRNRLNSGSIAACEILTHGLGARLAHVIEFLSLGAAGLVRQDKDEEKGSKQMRIRLVLTFGVLLGWGPHLAAEVLYTITDLGTLGGYSSSASGINNAGQIVGTSNTSTGESHAFLYSDGQMQDLGTLGGPSSYGNSINNAGQVVGRSQISTNSSYYPFLYSNGQMTNLGTLGPPYTAGSYATGINDAGQIAGYAETPSDPNYSVHAFLYSNGQITDLSTLGGPSSYGGSINNAGQVVGRSQISTNSSYYPFLYSNGQMTALNSLLDLTQTDPALRNSPLMPTSINDKGQIVAVLLVHYCIDVLCPEEYRAYLLTPVPGTGPCWGWFCSGEESGNTDNSGHPGTPPARAISLRNGSDQPDTQSGSVQR